MIKTKAETPAALYTPVITRPFYGISEVATAAYVATVRYDAILIMIIGFGSTYAEALE